MLQWVENSPVMVWRILGTGALEVLVDGILVVVVVEAVPHRAEHHVLPRYLQRRWGCIANRNITGVRV